MTDALKNKEGVHPRKHGAAFFADLHQVRNEYSTGLVEAKALMERFGSYEAVRDHLGAGGIVESAPTTIARLEAEIVKLRADNERLLGMVLKPDAPFSEGAKDAARDEAIDAEIAALPEAP